MNIWRRILFATIIMLFLVPTQLVMANADLNSSAVIPAAKVTLVTPINNRLTKELEPTLRWKLILGAADYQLQLSPNKNFSGDLLDKIFPPVLDTLKTAIFTTANYGTLPWLTPNRAYYWHVRGCGSDQLADCGAWSETRFFIPKYGAADKPVLDTPANGASDVSPIKPTFKWSRLPNDSQYEIMITSIYNVRTRFVKPDAADPNFASFVPADNLAGLTNFTWKVRAVGKSGSYYGPWSLLFHFKTLVNPTPPTPKDKIILTAPKNNVLLNTTKPVLKWKAKAEMARYQVQISWDKTFVSIDKIDTNIVSDPNATAYAFLAANYGDQPWLTENRPYYWRVRGCKDDTEALCTIWSTRNYVPRYRTDQVPVLLTVINNAVAGSLQPTLTWQRLPNDWKYELWLVSSKKVVRLWFSPVGSDSVATFITPPLLPTTKYHWMVRAVGYKSRYNGKTSSVASFTTPPIP